MPEANTCAPAQIFLKSIQSLQFSHPPCLLSGFPSLWLRGKTTPTPPPPPQKKSFTKVTNTISTRKF